MIAACSCGRLLVPIGTVSCVSVHAPGWVRLNTVAPYTRRPTSAVGGSLVTTCVSAVRAAAIFVCPSPAGSFIEPEESSTRTSLPLAGSGSARAVPVVRPVSMAVSVMARSAHTAGRRCPCRAVIVSSSEIRCRKPWQFAIANVKPAVSRSKSTTANARTGNLPSQLRRCLQSTTDGGRREGSSPMDQTAHNIQQQIDLYGEPLGEVVRRVAGPLGLNQSALAQVIGLSAPMLSQLMSAQRVKIGNPAVVSRLRAVSQLADLAVAGEIDPEDIPGDLDRIRAATGAYDPTTTHLPRSSAHLPGQVTDSATPFAAPAGLPAPTSQPAPAVPHDLTANTSQPARAVVREIQDLFRAVASAEEIQAAAAAAAEHSPAVAELLLAYGTGRTADALAHYEKHHG